MYKREWKKKNKLTKQTAVIKKRITPQHCQKLRSDWSESVKILNRL